MNREFVLPVVVTLLLLGAGCAGDYRPDPWCNSVVPSGLRAAQDPYGSGIIDMTTAIDGYKGFVAELRSVDDSKCGDAGGPMLRISGPRIERGDRQPACWFEELEAEFFWEEPDQGQTPDDAEGTPATVVYAAIEPTPGPSWYFGYAIAYEGVLYTDWVQLMECPQILTTDETY